MEGPFLKNLTTRPGVYRMLDAEGTVLYVGKARNLKQRLANYFVHTDTDPKKQVLVSQIHRIEVTVTHTESEALILENHLIKALKPRYNVLLRDDKSYPYIFLSTEDEYPRLAFYRGAKQEKGRFFGPYPNAGAVRETLSLLQKLFPVRQCESNFFRNRSRPCLQYQIKRCTAPCVGLIDPETYRRDVYHAVLFLEGKSSQVIDDLVHRMENASTTLDFEQAARYRDQITSLRRVQEKQYVSGESGDVDIIAGVVHDEFACVQVFFIRAGRNLGNKTFFPRMPAGLDANTIVQAFLPQYYLNHTIPSEILVNHEPEEVELLQTVLAEQAGHKVTLSSRLRGERAHWVKMAVQNAEYAINARLASRAGMGRRIEALQEVLHLDEPPARMECFDISHTMGDSTVASCVVFDAEGPVKSDYRHFNIRDIRPGDDYAAMEQALMRRYTRLKKGEGKLPDILFIDGGKGQLAIAERVLEELQVEGLVLVGVAKGADRKPGLETLFIAGQATPIHLPAHSPALHLIQQIRDEAHRFAITGHRHRRARAQKASILEEIPRLGPKRRQHLLKQFGGLREVARAGVEDLAQVPGISPRLAEQIYAAFHAKN